jgi:hypothetical protein
VADAAERWAEDDVASEIPAAADVRAWGDAGGTDPLPPMAEVSLPGLAVDASGAASGMGREA